MKSSDYSGVSKYYHHRHPYLPQFFEGCARHLGLNRSHRLLDIACGIGVVARGFSKLVGEVVAIDKSQEMINLALEECRGSSNIRFLCSPFEDIDNVGEFDVATIGRAIHWFDRDNTLKRLKGLLKRRSHVIICGSGFANEESGWLRAYSETKARWSKRTTKPEIDGIAFFKNSDFVFQTRTEIVASQQLTVEDLVNHSMSYSSVFDQVNAARENYRHELECALLPFLRNGCIQAKFLTWGTIFRYS